MSGVLLVLLTILGFSLLLGTAAVRLLVRLLRRGRRRGPALLWTDRLLFTVGGVALLCFLYGLWIEPRWVEVTTVPVEMAEIPPGTPPIRVVQLSDFHAPSNLALQRRLPELVAGLRPDLIVFTGDAVNRPGGVAPFRETMRRLAETAPVLAVRGNRDRGAVERVDLFGGTGARELRGAAVEVTVRGVPLAFVGASRRGDWTDVYRALRRQPEGRIAVYVAHSPDVTDDVARWGADLVLAGHTHGGQVALPGYGALWTSSRFGKRFEAGLYEVDGARLYVNRGIGMEATLPPVRFLARPEVTVLELRPAG